MPGLSELLDALAGAGPRFDAAELAEALWLAKAITDAESAPDDRPLPEEEPAHASDAWSPSPVPTGGRAVAGLSATQSVESPDAGASGPPVGAMGVPRVPAVPHQAALLSELRPLARRTPVRHVEVFDETATVERTAATGVRWPVSLPGALRERELCVLLDRDPAMAAWEGLAEDVRRLFEAVGGFRRITVEYCESGPDARLRVADRRDTPALRPLSALRDPSGRRIVVVLTAGLGDAWACGSAAQDLGRLATAGPVAVAQPLPARMWRRTALDWAYGSIEPCFPGRPGALRTVREDAGRLTPIPVFELAPGWLRPWVRMLTGDGSPARFPLLRHGTVTAATVSGLVDAGAGGPDGGDAGRPRSTQQAAALGTDPEDQVRRFRSASSPEAYRLAVLLSVVSLNPPVMRLIHRAVMPGTGPSVLAEVIAGGLLEPAEPPSGPASAGPVYGMDEERRVFVFRRGVVEVLRRALRRSEAAEVLSLASTFVEKWLDVPVRLFQAALSVPASGEGGLPFAYVSARTLQHVAPQFPETAPEDLGPAAVEREYDRFRSQPRGVGAPAGPEDLADSVRRARRLLEALPVGDARRPEVLEGLIDLLYQRWQTRPANDPADLLEAVALAKASIAEIGDDASRAARLVLLAALLRRQFDQDRSANLLVESVRVLRAALRTAPVDERRGDWLDQLGDTLCALGRELGEPVYYTDAIDNYNEAERRSAAQPRGERRAGLLLLKSVLARLEHAEMIGEREPVRHRVVADFRRALAYERPDETAFRALVASVINRAAALDAAHGGPAEAGLAAALEAVRRSAEAETDE